MPMILNFVLIFDLSGVISQLRSKFFNGEQSSTSITGAAFLIAAMGLVSRILGMLRDRILAAKFGAGDTLDAYYAAFKIPDLVFNLLIVGALSAAFVPVFTSLISKEKKDEAWRLANTVLTVGSMSLVILAVILLIVSPQLVSVITFGFSDEKKGIVVGLTRIMLISPIVLGISGIIGGILNSFKKFFYYSLAPIFYNVGIIIGAVVFTNFWGVQGLAGGVVLGAVFHLLVQLPEVSRCGFQFRFALNLKDVFVRKVGRLMVPRTMGLAVTQINFLIVTILASTLKSGSLAIFNFANNLQSVPLGVFAISFSVAAFPTLSSLWAQDKKDEFIENFSKTFRQIMFFVIPLSVLLIVLRAQIVRVILGSGKFDWEDTIMTFQALGIFSLSLFAQSLVPLLARTFYALHNTRIPFVVGIISEVANLALGLLLIRHYEILGLVWAFTISTILNMSLLLLILHKKIGSLDEKNIIASVWKILFATFVAAVVTQFLKWVLSMVVDMQTFVGIFIQLSASLAAGLGAFVAVGNMLKLEELTFFVTVIKQKLIKPKVLLDEQRDEVGGI
jgi:putative peptidoglycan lipid II flippase